jgi:para-aminobenzoate synthetase component I
VANTDQNLEIINKINGYANEGVPFFLLVDFEMKKPLVIPLDQLKSHGILIDFPSFSNVHKKIEAPLEGPSMTIKEVSKDVYSDGFDKVMHHLLQGDTYLINLTSPVKVSLTESLENLFHKSVATYKVFMNNHFLCFSPEIFVRISENIISTYPMKGTIDAKLENAEIQLIENEKELAEHYTIVDLLRNDLSVVAKKVRVKKFRYIDVITTNKKKLLQTSSCVLGELTDDWQKRLGQIIFSMLPAGSVSGAPKKRTCEIIASAEGSNRGYYTGIAGVFDGESFDSCVLIRFVEQTPDGFVYRAGGGITTQSMKDSEFDELIDKVYVPIV